MTIYDKFSKMIAKMELASEAMLEARNEILGDLDVYNKRSIHDPMKTEMFVSSISSTQRVIDDMIVQTKIFMHRHAIIEGNENVE